MATEMQMSPDTFYSRVNEILDLYPAFGGGFTAAQQRALAVYVAERNRGGDVRRTFQYEHPVEYEQLAGLVQAFTPGARTVSELQQARTVEAVASQTAPSLSADSFGAYLREVMGNPALLRREFTAAETVALGVYMTEVNRGGADLDAFLYQHEKEFVELVHLIADFAHGAQGTALEAGKLDESARLALYQFTLEAGLRELSEALATEARR